MRQQLESEGVPTLIEFGQGFVSMSEPTKELERLVVSRQLRHGGNPVMTWMAGNVTVERDSADNIKPSKRKSTEKIDGIVSLVMAIGRAMVSKNKPDEVASVYDDRGIIEL